MSVINVPDLATTHAIAATLARLCHPGDCIALNGDLGAGKTSFARGFIGALYSGSEEIVSPTFTLVQTYPTRDGNTVWHFDLYRLKSTQELTEIGLDEALQSGFTLIEWPQLARQKLPANTLDITISVGAEPDNRVLTLNVPDAWQTRLDPLKAFI